MYDARSIASEIDCLVKLHGLAVAAVKQDGSKSSNEQKSQSEALLQKQFEASFIQMGSAFEFGLRQILDFLTLHLVISASLLDREKIYSLSTLGDTLKTSGYLKKFCGSAEWGDIFMLAKVRNKIVHVLGWHDDVEFTPKNKMRLNRYGFIPSRGLTPLGSVERFQLTEETALTTAHLYKKSILKVHKEIAEQLHAHP